MNTTGKMASLRPPGKTRNLQSSKFLWVCSDTSDTVGRLRSWEDHAANSPPSSYPTKLWAEEREWKVLGIRKIHFFSGWNKKAGWARSGGTKLESLELIGGNSRPPLTLDNMDHKISYKLNITRLFRQRAQIRKLCRLTKLAKLRRCNTQQNVQIWDKPPPLAKKGT